MRGRLKALAIAVTATGILFTVVESLTAQHGDDPQLLSKLKASRHTLVPAVQGGRPVVDVLVATRDGQTKHVMIDLR